MLKKIRSFIENLKKSSTRSPEKPDLTVNYKMLAVEHTIIEKVLESIEVAAKEQFLLPNEAKLLKDRYVPKLQALNQSIDRYLVTSERQRLEEIKQQMQKKHEIKINYLEKQIRNMDMSSLQSSARELDDKGALTINQNGRLKTLNGELMSAIEHLERIDRVSYLERE